MKLSQFELLESIEKVEKKRTLVDWFELVAVVLEFARQHLFNNGVLSIPKWYNIPMWVRLGKFLIDIINIIIHGKDIKQGDFSKPFMKIVEDRNNLHKTKDKLKLNEFAA